jgi:broad specificity phosphatase PhoE
MPPTVLYLVRHGATEANLASSPRLLGRRLDLPLASAGISQAEATRDAPAGIRLDHCYTSPLRRAQQTATILCEPHGLPPQPLDALADFTATTLTWARCQSATGQYNRLQPASFAHVAFLALRSDIGPESPARPG